MIIRNHTTKSLTPPLPLPYMGGERLTPLLSQ